MLGVLSLRPTKPCSITPHTFSLHCHHHNNNNPYQVLDYHDNHPFKVNDASPSIWRVIVPAAAGGGDWRRDYLRPSAPPPLQKGEGSWNVASDARPARWLHRLDLTYLMLGVCLCLAPFDWNDVVVTDAHTDTATALADADADAHAHVYHNDFDRCSSNSNYRVTGVLADGRCLFRAIAHGVCLQSGAEVPDEDRQRELADDLRAQVVEELMKRRKEIEWFIEGDFDAYVTRIQQPYVWGGEPELLMASHVLKKLISVFMKDKSTGELTNIATYGEEYKNEEHPINVLFHGYGHYELLEASLT